MDLAQPHWPALTLALALTITLIITLILTLAGGCGSRYPASKNVSIVQGSAVVFENIETYHRMTALALDPLYGQPPP